MRLISLRFTLGIINEDRSNNEALNSVAITNDCHIVSFRIGV